MISVNLKIFLAIITVIYFIIILIAIKKQTMPVKSSVLWIVFGVIMFISIFTLIIFIFYKIKYKKVSKYLKIAKDF